MPPRAFEDRHFAPRPPPTNAQEAATRVYNRGGILVRSDPYISAADRNGREFPPTQWHEEPELTATMPPARAVARRPDPKKKLTVFDRFKKKLLERGGAGGIAAFGRCFRIMDDNHNWSLDADELQTGLKDYGVKMYRDEIEELIDCIDKDGSGRINYDEFLVAIRGDINPRREKMIMMAFQVMDKDGSGKIGLEDVINGYSINHDPDVLSGRMSEADCLTRFLGNFEGVQKDGVVTKDEFIDYYRNVSASIDNDDYFELMIRNAWHIPGGDGWCANTSNTRLLIVLRDGMQKVVCIENDLGLDLHDHDAVMAQLRAQGITNVVKFTLSGNV